MKKYTIYFRVNTYLVNRDYEELIGDVDLRTYNAENEDAAIEKLHNEIDDSLTDTATKVFDLEIGSIEEA